MGRAPALQAGEASSSLAARSFVPRTQRTRLWPVTAAAAVEDPEDRKTTARQGSPDGKRAVDQSWGPSAGSSVGRAPARQAGRRKFEPCLADHLGPVAHLGECLPCKQEVAGSSPVRSTWARSSVGSSAGLTNRKSPVRSWPCPPFRSVLRSSIGSGHRVFIPARGVQFPYGVPSAPPTGSYQGLLSPGVRVQILPGSPPSSS